MNSKYNSKMLASSVNKSNLRSNQSISQNEALSNERN